MNHYHSGLKKGKDMRFILLVLLQFCLFAADFDCILVGTSPFSLFEALYQCHSGKKVLILEESPLCGGAWKSISICGIPHADLGCHEVGNDASLKAFLEEYAGCKIVSMDNPLMPFENGKSTNGYYFSQGCFELIDHLLKLIAATDIVLLNNSKVEKVTVDTVQNMAWVQTATRTFSTPKLIVTPMSCFPVNPSSAPQNYAKSKYYHLYLLIQDPTPPRFSYQGNSILGVSRLVNLTHFVGLTGTGRQLIVIQMHNEQGLSQAQTYLDKLKESKLVDPSAYILTTEPYIYEAGTFHQGLISQMGAQNIIEMLQTGHFRSLSNYVPKWKTVLKPYNAVLPNS